MLDSNSQQLMTKKTP